MKPGARHLQQALQWHQSGRLAEAEQAYRSVLKQEPRNVQATQLLGVLSYQRGRLQEAATLIETAIRADPRVADFHNNLGEVYRAMGRFADAAKSYRRALALNPNYTYAHNNLALALDALGEKQKAIRAFEDAVRLDPYYLEALSNLGMLYQSLGDRARATACFEQVAARHPAALQNPSALAMLAQALAQIGRRQEGLEAIEKALQLAPEFPEAHYTRGLILAELKRQPEALACFERAATLRPDFAEALNSWANILIEQKEFDAAGQRLATAMRLKPGLPEIHNNLGLRAKALGRYDEALAHFARALEIKPGYPEALNNRGVVFWMTDEKEKAFGELEQALKARPDYGTALNNLAGLLLEIGQFGRARKLLQQAVALEPDAAASYLNLTNIKLFEGDAEGAIRIYESMLGTPHDSPVVGSNHLYALACSSTVPAAEVAQRHRDWERRYGQSLAPFRLKPRSLHPRLRVGLVSADLHDHSVARFLLPLLTRLGAETDLVVYADTRKTDVVTTELMRGSKHWHSSVGWKDDQLGEQIQAEEIDVLIDLSGHTARNRMLLFTRRPAPVQVSYLGYPNTTGLTTMDYRIVDTLSDPPGLTDPFYTEKLCRLTGCAWCYRAPLELPVPGATARAPGEFCFGSFNNLTKLSPTAFGLWAQVLQATPHAKMVMKARGLADPELQEELLLRFESFGVARQRICFSPWTKTLREHFDYYANVDVALDSFPYHGTTTTCDALWMGVPVVTLAGEMHHSRVGVSLLTNVGHPEWIASSPEEFVQIAVGLASDPARLAEIKGKLRQDMVASPLRDEIGFARNFVAALHAMHEEKSKSVK